jgi:hypothetical protein
MFFVSIAMNFALKANELANNKADLISIHCFLIRVLRCDCAGLI